MTQITKHETIDVPPWLEHELERLVLAANRIGYLHINSHKIEYETMWHILTDLRNKVEERMKAL